MDKTGLRNNALQQRRALQSHEVIELSQTIAERLHDLISWNTVHQVHVYTSKMSLNEVDTAGICKQLSYEFPAIVITKGEPSKQALIPTSMYDVIIVPLVAFDGSCHRIGFGGGWYDRFLSTQPQARKIGLAYELQRVEAIPVEQHDELLDAVVTEKQVYVPNKNAPT